MEALDQDSAPKELFYTEGPPTLRDARLQACAHGPSPHFFLLLLGSRPPRPLIQMREPSFRCGNSHPLAARVLSARGGVQGTPDLSDTLVGLLPQVPVPYSGRAQIARFSMERAAARLAAARRRRESADEDEDAEADEAVSAARRVVNQVRRKGFPAFRATHFLSVALLDTVRHVGTTVFQPETGWSAVSAISIMRMVCKLLAYIDVRVSCFSIPLHMQCRPG